MSVWIAAENYLKESNVARMGENNSFHLQSQISYKDDNYYNDNKVQLSAPERYRIHCDMQ